MRLALVAVAVALLGVLSDTASADDAASGRLAELRNDPRRYTNPDWHGEVRLTPRYLLVSHPKTDTEAAYNSLIVGAERGKDLTVTCVGNCDWVNQHRDPDVLFHAAQGAFRVVVYYDDGHKVAAVGWEKREPRWDRRAQAALSGDQGMETRIPAGAKKLVRVEITAYFPGPSTRLLPVDPAGIHHSKVVYAWPLNLPVAVAVAVDSKGSPIVPVVINPPKKKSQDTGPGSPEYEAALAAIAAMLAAWAALFGLTITPVVEDPDQALIDDDGPRLPTRRKNAAAVSPPEEHWTSPLPPTTTTDGLPPPAPPPPAPVGEDGLPLPEPSKVKLAPPPEHWAQPQPEPEQHWAQLQPEPEQHWAQPQPEPTAVDPATTPATATNQPPADYTQGLNPPPADFASYSDDVKALWEKVKAGDPEARETWKSLMGSTPESAAQNAAQIKAGGARASAELKQAAVEAVVEKGIISAVDKASPAVGAALKEIGGAETLKELTNLDWKKEVSDTGSAIHKSAQKAMDEAVQSTVDFVSDRKEDIKQLASMDSSEWKGVAKQEVQDYENSAFGKKVQRTVDGVVDLSSMDSSELKGTLGQVAKDAKDAVVNKVDEAKQLASGMTLEELQGHGQQAADNVRKAVDDAGKAIDRAKQDAWRMDPDKAREKLADLDVEVGKQIVVAAGTEGLGSVAETAQAALKGGKIVEEGTEALNLARTGGKVSEGLESVTAEERAIATAKTEVNTALKDTEIGAGRTTVNEPAVSAASKSGTAEGLTGDGKPVSSLTQEEKNIAASKTQVGPKAEGEGPVGRHDGVTEGGARKPAVTPQDDRVIIHTSEDGKHWELGGHEVNADGSPIKPLSDGAAVDPKAPTGPVPKSGPGEGLTGDGKRLSSLTQEDKNIANAETQLNPALKKTEIGAGGTTVNEPAVSGASKSGTAEGLTGDGKPLSQLTQEERDIAAAKTGRFEPSPESSGGRAASDSSASPNTTKFETADMPGDKPTGPRGTERLEPKDLPDGGKDPGPGVERGPDGRHPIRMTREEARVRLGENIDPASPRPGGAEAPTPELPRDLRKTETALRPQGEVREAAAPPKPELPETAARPAMKTAEGPTTGKLPDPEMPAPAQPETVKRPAAPESAVHSPNDPPITGNERQELLARASDPAHVPDVSASDMNRYKEAVVNARDAAGGRVGSCEKAQQSLVDQLGGKVAMNDGKLVGAIDHSVVVTKEGLILDPVSRQAIEQGYVTAGQVKAAGLTKAMEEGVFTPKQWAKFNSLGGRGARF